MWYMKYCTFLYKGLGHLWILVLGVVLGSVPIDTKERLYFSLVTIVIGIKAVMAYQHLQWAR